MCGLRFALVFVGTRRFTSKAISQQVVQDTIFCDKLETNSLTNLARLGDKKEIKCDYWRA